MTVLRDKGGFLSPVISIVDHDGARAVLKDYRSRNFVTRGVIAPVLVKREYSILRHLEGIPGIPRAYKVIEKRALLLEYVDGQTLGKFRPGELADSVFERLCRVVRAMHHRGVVHLDLRQKKNIVIGADGKAWLLDFANALRKNAALAPMWNKLCAVDESALLKFKKRCFPHLVTDADREALEKHKFLRKFWIFTKRGKSVR